MYRVLAALAEQEQPLRLVELSALTSADLSTLSRLVGRYAQGRLRLARAGLPTTSAACR